jgi:hypothetical protein
VLLTDECENGVAYLLFGDFLVVGGEERVDRVVYFCGESVPNRREHDVTKDICTNIDTLFIGEKIGKGDMIEEGLIFVRNAADGGAERLKKERSRKNE